MKVVFKNIEYPILFEDLIRDLDVRIETTEWISKANPYIVYNFEPINSEYFTKNITIKGDSTIIAYLKYLYETNSNFINSLHGNLDKEAGEDCGQNIIL